MKREGQAVCFFIFDVKNTETKKKNYRTILRSEEAIFKVNVSHQVIAPCVGCLRF